MTASVELFGRREETSVLDGLVSRARSGAGGALVLWGEPGIGKTALLHHLRDQAADFLRLSHQAARTESTLPYAGLHALLRPVADRIESPAGTRFPALRDAFASSGGPANPLAVGAALLSLLCELAQQQPVLVALDDAQRLDDATALCLGIVARRVRAHPVVVAVADHSDPAARPWEGTPGMRVEGLTEASARHLVATMAPDADEATVRNTVDQAGGNPLALLEPAVTGGDSADAEHHHADRARPPVGPRLRRAFRAAIEALSPPAQLLTVLAAAEEHGDRRTLQRAGNASGVDDTAWEETVNAGLLHVMDDSVGFRHPIVRGAVYEGAGAAARRRAHRALAAVLAEEAEDRAWHLAAATYDHDEDVAALLERAAARSRLRGDAMAAARALWRAAELSPAPIDASQRLAGAARAAWDAGRAATAQRLLDDAERLAPGAHIARRSHGLRGVIEFARGTPELAHHYLTTDMNLVSDPPTALELGTTAMRAGWSAGRDDLWATALGSLLELDADDRAGLGALLACWSDDPADGVAGGGSGFDDVVVRARATALGLLPPSPLALAWGIDEPMGQALHRRTRRLRLRVEPADLAGVLAHTATLDSFAGRWTDAESAAAEGLRLAQDVGADQVAAHCRNCLGWLAAARGDERTVTEVTADVLRTSLPQGVRAVSAAAYWIRGMASLFHERPEEALEMLMRLAEPGHGAAHPTFALLAALDTAEAAVHVGRHDVAEERVHRLHAWARRTAAPWARSAAHAAEALLGGPGAESAFRTALEVPGARSQPLLHARVQLFYGEWLRRGRRRTDARVHLGGALEVFDRLGAEPLRRRARREWDLTGPPGRRGSPEAGETGGLTAQEQRIARLAAEQLTNREIAAKLRISHRTVGHHLGNVYAKLGINTRAGLSLVYADSEPG
ncbi:AAA family ATPase [Nocardiopsis mangrovi]|uniref:AAA family ATPase n=1 Tax=Nocardiopsis mangrovi TaxID=1179818 RepID=A0ABV9DT20_9ACTN